MRFILHFHPFASFCWKPLIALYENEIPFKPMIVDLGDQTSRNSFLKLWPLGEFPVLEDVSRQELIPQSSAIVEFLALHGGVPFKGIPHDAERAREARRWDAFFDSYVQLPMQKIVGDVLRPEGQHDPFGVKEAHETLRTAYTILEERVGGWGWFFGDEFTLTDCAAAPALHYAERVEPFRATHPRLGAYLDHLKGRPSFARVLKEAEPYEHLFPYKRQLATSSEPPRASR
jgi:glutathione S-transferase